MRCNGAIVPAAELYSEREVFVIELGKLFFHGWTLLDHASRLRNDGQRFLYNVATRSYIVVQENRDCLHAFRNRCLHAGYPICEEGDSQTNGLLVCKYHDWRYTLDGNLIHAPHLASSADLSAFFLKRYMVRRRAGLLFMAPGTSPDSATIATEPEAEVLAIQPHWLESAAVSSRRDYTLPMNWKHLHWRLPSLLPGFLPEHQDPIRHRHCGPLSWFAVADECAAIFRLIPRSAHETVLNIIWMSPKNGDASESSSSVPSIENDALERELERVMSDSSSYAPGSAAAKFFNWYYSVLTQPET